jgi:hypothetical protein
MRKIVIAKLLVLAAASLSPAAALAQAEGPPPEARVPDMARFIETVRDGEQGVYIRAYNGRWYYARTQSECPRLGYGNGRLSFRTAPNGDLDRHGAVVADGWRCQLASVIESGPPPSRR